jgi:hypothetical protein
MLRLLLMLAVLTYPALPDSAPAGFAALHRLAGDWEAKTASGSTIRVSYRSIAGDSALVESFKTPSGRETLTIYHPDGASLIATHYCAQGNQPRLRLEPGETETALQFSFYDATNLPDTNASHLTRLKFQISNDRFDRTEIYTERGKEDVTIFHFVRIPSTVNK